MSCHCHLVPNTYNNAYLRLLTFYLMEQTKEWEVERSDIQPQKLELAMIKCEELLQEAV